MEEDGTEGAPARRRVPPAEQALRKAAIERERARRARLWQTFRAADAEFRQRWYCAANSWGGIEAGFPGLLRAWAVKLVQAGTVLRTDGWLAALTAYTERPGGITNYYEEVAAQVARRAAAGATEEALCTFLSERLKGRKGGIRNAERVAAKWECIPGTLLDEERWLTSGPPQQGPGQ